ncbi:MAG: hypothetical protein EOP51_24895, partial [Sphingobacteriales bacterium]
MKKLSFLLSGLLLLSSIVVKAQYITQGNALNFGGTGYVSIPDAAHLKPATVTAEAWIKPNTAAGSVPVLLKLNSRGAGLSNNEAYSIYLNNGKFSAIMSSSGGVVAAATQQITYTIGKWYHVTAIFNNTNVILYVNGILQQTTLTGFGLTYNTGPLTLGGNSDGSVLADAVLDEVRIFSTNRSAQVTADMFQFVNPISNPGLVASYNFNQGSAGADNTAITTLTDQTANANNGVLTNLAMSGNTANFVESYAGVIPTAGNGTAVLTTSFTANWAAPTSGTVDTYLLDVSTDINFSSFVTGYEALPVTGNTKVVTGLTSGTIYFYRIRAEKTTVTGQGGYSSTIRIKTTPVAPSISYTTPQTLTVDGNAITAIAPVNIGGNITAAGAYAQMSTIAGNGALSNLVAGPALSSPLRGPIGMVSDGTSLYFSEGFYIGKIDIATNTISVLTGRTFQSTPVDGNPATAVFQNITSMTSDGEGNLYVSDGIMIRKIVMATGSVTTLAGSSTTGAVDGTGTQATFQGPLYLTYDGNGNLYISDQANYRIRKLNLSTLAVTTIAGSSAAYQDALQGVNARFSSPTWIEH